MVCSTILVIVILYQRYWAPDTVPPDNASCSTNIESLGPMVAPRLKHSVRLEDLELEYVMQC